MVTSITRSLPADLPAFLGGEPAFPGGLPLARPRVEGASAVAKAVTDALESGALTNGAGVREFERRTAEYLGVRHCIAVASCTSGLMLVLKASQLTGDVVVPSFTFAATAHAVAWNGLRPVFADIDPNTLTLSADDVRRAISVRTSAILATHVFGTPCDVESLTRVAEEAGIRLFYDAAHAFGSRRGHVPIGNFGDAEVFSLSPTKPLIAAEGGLIATDDDMLAERCRIGRDYGNPGDYDCRFVGLNARMSELHAAVALASFEGLEDRLAERNALAAGYRAAFVSVPGVSFPMVGSGDRSTYKDLTVLVDESVFGMSATALACALDAEGIETRRYYSPPVHRMRAFRSLPKTIDDLPVTERVAAEVLTLPLWVGMSDADVVGVAEAVRRIQAVVTGPRSPVSLLPPGEVDGED